MFRPLTIFRRHRNEQPTLREDDEYDPFFRLHREMNRLFGDVFADYAGASVFDETTAKGVRPAHVEVHETDGALEIEAELPGVAEEDIDVELTDRYLTIRAEKQHSKTEGDDGVTERSYSAFARTMTLPFEVDSADVDARFKNGVLKLILPKPRELTENRKKIEVRRA